MAPSPRMRKASRLSALNESGARCTDQYINLHVRGGGVETSVSPTRMQSNEDSLDACPSALTDAAQLPYQESQSSYHSGSQAYETTAPISRPTTSIRSRSRMSIAPSSDVSAAVCLGRGVNPTIGLAFMELTSGRVMLSQVNDNQTFVKTVTKLHTRAPAKILLQAGECPPSDTGSLYELVQEVFDTSRIIPIDRRYWSEKSGTDSMRCLTYEDDYIALQVAIHGKYYAICAFAAVSFKGPSPNAL